MATLTNPLAPELTGTLSAEVEQLVRERVSMGGLSAYACRDVAAIRRSTAERDRDTAMRPAFVRDAEKIVHLPAYNRLGGKTQVFSFRADDDLCRRGLHVQLVARVARDIGRALGLNLDLIEAIALGHDLGHTPFGHAGERYLNQAFNRRCGRWFFHNVQSVRVLDVLGGRNVSLQVLDGTLCHNGEFEQQVFETSGLAEFDTFDRVVDSCWRSGEQAIAHFAERYELPVVHNVCPADKHTKRQEVKELIVTLQAQYPDLKSKVFGAMQRLPLPKWGPEEK